MKENPFCSENTLRSSHCCRQVTVLKKPNLYNVLLRLREYPDLGLLLFYLTRTALCDWSDLFCLFRIFARTLKLGLNRTTQYSIRTFPRCSQPGMASQPLADDDSSDDVNILYLFGISILQGMELVTPFKYRMESKPGKNRSRLWRSNASIWEWLLYEYKV